MQVKEEMILNFLTFAKLLITTALLFALEPNPKIIKLFKTEKG